MLVQKENPAAPMEFVRRAERFYAALMAHVSDAVQTEHGLGGTLVYAGELDEDGRALMAAGNSAGAATLAATADPAAQKQAVREGIVDFLVTSLDEALRILKNEVRKHATVAVCVGAAPDAVEQEMRERGVQPDLLRAGVHPWAQGSQQLEVAPPSSGVVRLEWRVSAAPALWMPKLDLLARACLLPVDGVALRWLRLSPRYCGRAAMSVRVVRCPAHVAVEFAARVAEAVKDGEVGVPVDVHTVAD